MPSRPRFRRNLRSGDMGGIRRTGSAAVEYALMLGLISVVVVSTVQSLGLQMRGGLDKILNESKPAPQPPPPGPPPPPP
jgi:Flp pilus assembly pilin Flp